MLTSEVIERKLPTLKTKHFSEPTCDALLDLVLRGCSTQIDSGDSSLVEIAERDGALAEWLQRQAVRLRLAEGLVRDDGWRSETVSAERLWQASNVAIRLSTLEHHFESELAKQKRDAIYHFAYGLSHELNNPLANIATRAGVLVHGESSVARRQMLETIIDSAMRGSEMMGDLMLLARPPRLNFVTVNLPEWFGEFKNRCDKWAVQRNLAIESSSELQTLSVKFDPVAITEGLWCLVRNAIEASPENGTVKIRLDELPESIRFSVCDSGPGLSAEGLRHCFDPYYSGREAGRGLGLGLSKAHLIATMHRGTLTVANRAAEGCEAILTLPK